jgi:hypothetical protein
MLLDVGLDPMFSLTNSAAHSNFMVMLRVGIRGNPDTAEMPIIDQWWRLSSPAYSRN